MKLRDIFIDASENSLSPEKRETFWRENHHICALFLHILGKKTDFGKAHSCVIYFGKCGNMPKYINCMGVITVFIENFDFEKYFSLNKNERQLLVIENVKTQLHLIATQEKICPGFIDEVFTKMVQMNFFLRHEVKKLSKSHNKLGIKIKVFRELSATSGEFWQLEISKRKSKICDFKVDLTKKPSFLDKSDSFQKSKIEENYFYIVNPIDRKVFSLKLNHNGREVTSVQIVK